MLPLTSPRFCGQRGSGEKGVQKRYHLTSHKPDARRQQQLIRQHWSIENQCHWVLDVTFDEDQCRARKDHAAQNLAMLRKVTLSLLKQDTTIKDTLRGKRYRAALDETVLEAILFPENSKRGSPGGGFRGGKISLGLREDRPSLAPATMARKEFTILNKLGIHARPAAQFVKTANKFSADIFVEKDGEEVDGKSIMGLMMLAAGHGSVITVSADGEDADAAIAAIGDLIERKFEED